MKRNIGLLCALAALCAAAAWKNPGVVEAKEIGFIEEFALAEDRSEPLKQLIPGTEDYYYYHCLHYLNTAQFDEADKTLKLWLKRSGRNSRIQEIEYRKALLQYGKNPAATLEYLRKELKLHFNHQKEKLDHKPNLPTRLDQKLIDREKIIKNALSGHPQTLGGFEDSGLDLLIGRELNADQLRHLLRRMQRPDFPGDLLPQLIVKDLANKDSRPFGSLGIHNRLTLVQLDACARLRPTLLNETNFVNAYLLRLRPDADSDWRRDAAERQAYLDRLWKFVSPLTPVHNSLKAHVLYQRLVHDRALGVTDKDRFLAYLKLPRNAGYIPQEYLRLNKNRAFVVNLNQNFQAQTLMPPIRNDEALVRDYLSRLFLKEKSYDPYLPYVRDTQIKEWYAETMVVNGVGDKADLERWYSTLPPAKYQALKERIDLEFSPANKTLFGVDEPVRLDLAIKNVAKLIVKVYEINTPNYYREKGKEIDTDINLDGLVANEETVHSYTEPPLRRVARSFDFPKLKARGVYVIEFIGNGKSSRALVRKGRLRFLERVGVAGHVFTVLDERNRLVDNASIWISGRLYKPADNGRVTVPFSTKPGRQAMAIIQGDFASLDFFNHQAETYKLAAGIHVDRETLLKQRKATVVIRPALTVNGTPAPLKALTETRLTITSIDGDGVSSTKEVPNFLLAADRESTYTFQVPDRLTSIAFALRAKVRNISKNKDEQLAVSETFALNAIDATAKVEDLHFGHLGESYTLDLLGRTGEPMPDRPVNLILRPRDLRDSIHITLQTNAKGRITLGPLKDIAWIEAEGPEKTKHRWSPAADAHSYPGAVHGQAGEPVLVPYMGRADKPFRAELSLLETRGGAFYKDRFDALQIKDGFIQIDDLPAGDYDLLIKPAAVRIALRLAGVHGGKKPIQENRYVLAANRHLEVRNPAPLQIVSVEADADAVWIQLANDFADARVHVAATRYLPAFPVFKTLGKVPFPEPYTRSVPKSESVYLSGRDIGDEYRYIIERKYAQKYAGNMLKRPSLLLNPWAVRKTETDSQQAAKGEEWSREAPASESLARRASPKAPPPARSQDFANLDFLALQAPVLLNLIPDENGVVAIDRKALGEGLQLHVVAVDRANTAYRFAPLSAAARPAILDMRLAQGLDPKLHFTEQKQISILKPGDELTLADMTTAKIETFDTLAKVYRLYATLTNDPTLAEFRFILNWPEMQPEQKREKYVKYASHELNFFLHEKDPQFFSQTVLPYIKNKKDKTFLDHWFLSNSSSAASLLTNYLQPWRHGQLNIAERSLLGHRLTAETAAAARHVRELNDLLPPNIERYNFLFKTALKGSALETAGLTAGFAGSASQRYNYDPRHGVSSLGDVFVTNGSVSHDGILASGGSGGGVEKLRELRVAGNGARALKSERYGVATSNAPAPAAARTPRGALKKSSDSRSKALASLADKENALSLRRSSRSRGRGTLSLGIEAKDADFDMAGRGITEALYRKLDKTQEFAENNYYHLPVEQTNANRVPVNAFWADYAEWDGQGAFFSKNLAESSRNFTEIMLALALLDLPFKAADHDVNTEKARMALTAKSPMVVFHQEIKEAKESEEKTPILITQNFFRQSDRYLHVNGERFDKFVTDEFLARVVYGCQIVVTNPTSSRRKLDLLFEIPRGAIPVLKGKVTRSVHIILEPYNTQTQEFYFYFPAPGAFAHYPVHVARDGALVAYAAPFAFNVVEKLTNIDKASWDYISQFGSSDDTINYLKENNTGRVQLAKIAWRMNDKTFFEQTTALLAGRHAFDPTLWSYGIKHDAVPAIREYLQHRADFLNRCGAWLDSPLVAINPVERKTYQHLEYDPLVNARAHRLGKKREILNDRFHAQYQRLLRVLSCRAELNADDAMAVTYYLLLQDRVEEALARFSTVKADDLQTRLQYDYFAAYLDFYTGDFDDARAIARRYAEYPVERWRKKFAFVSAQLDEIAQAANAAAAPVDKEDRGELQTRLAAAEPSLDFKVEAKRVVLNYQNLKEARVNYYLMDIELLFSRNPFVQEFSGQFSSIRPNATDTIQLDDAKIAHTFDLPERFHSANVMVEIESDGVKKSQAYYANSLNAQVIENYGQVRLTHAASGKPLPRVYVKVYARMRNGRVAFYKDGYTDPRGRFDYTSLNTNELDNVGRFSLLVLSETDGAIVREAAPPKR